MERMTATDAQVHWMSAKIPSDQFLLYCFADGGVAPESMVRELLVRAAAIDDLRLRCVEVAGGLDRPYWVSMQIDPGQVRVHHAPDWSACLAVVGDLIADQVDITEHPWRLHLFTRVAGAPDSPAGAVSTVAVLQISHVLADGTRASAIARELFGENAPGRAPARGGETLGQRRAALRGVGRIPVDLARLIPAAVRAFRGNRTRRVALETGQWAPPPSGGPLLEINTRPDDRRVLRVVLVDADRLRALGGTVTCGALVAISLALTDHLGLDTTVPLRAEVGIANAAPRLARNHFRNLGIDLCIDEVDLTIRARRIRDELANAARRNAHPVWAAEAAAVALFPGALLRWGVSKFDADVTPTEVKGNTVVSSVDRGAADLVLGGGAVRFTAGFPSLSPVQSLTHGVHGIGGRVAVSVCASPNGVPDVDGYVAVLAAHL